MLFVISSRLYLNDHHTTFLKKVAAIHHIHYCDINVHQKLKDISFGYRKEGPFLAYKGRIIKHPLFYVSAPLRTDSSLMEGVTYPFPQLYRNVLGQFFTDMSNLFTSSWIPGNIASMTRADSKPFALNLAQSMGILTPSFTINAPKFSKSLFRNGVYKKALGFPFIITSERKKVKEVGITRTNDLITDSKLLLDEDIPFQWQEPIQGTYHVRTHVVNNHVWSVRARKENNGDLRGLSDAEFKDLKWEPYILPAHLQTKLGQFIRKLGIVFASPEFLINKEGKHILIDINPCGDWYGFFPKNSILEIKNAHANLVLKKLFG